MSATDALDRIFNADRLALEAEEELLETPAGQLAGFLSEAVSEAVALSDPDESELRLLRLADLCGQVPGPEMVDALLLILDHREASVRTEAGEALLDVAFKRFKEVARGIERALARQHDGQSMQELPFILTEIRDPDPVPLVARFLQHGSGAVVAAAIEALAGFGDPSAAPHLKALLDDTREATLEDVDEGPTVIGDLAADALEELGVDEP